MNWGLVRNLWAERLLFCTFLVADGQRLFQECNLKIGFPPLPFLPSFIGQIKEFGGFILDQEPTKYSPTTIEKKNQFRQKKSLMLSTIHMSQQAVKA